MELRAGIVCTANKVLLAGPTRLRQAVGNGLSQFLWVLCFVELPVGF